MGKSKKSKLSLEIDDQIHNDESSIEGNKLQKLKNKKNKTSLSPDETKANQKFVDKTDSTKKKKKKNSENKEMETEISESLANKNEETSTIGQMQKTKKQKNKKSKLNKENESVQSPSPTKQNTETTKKKKTVESLSENVEAETNSVSQKKSKKRKRELVNESVPPMLEMKKKKKHLADEDESNVEEPEPSSNAKKRKLKHSNLENESTSQEAAKTVIEPKQKPKKKSENKSEMKGEEGRDPRTIFIGNVPVKYNKKAFEKLLKQKGSLERYWTRGYIPASEKITKKVAAIAKLLSEDQPPVVVYALFKTVADAQNALTLNGAIFEDHRLRVTLADKKQQPPELGVFVGNLPPSITDDELYDFFRQCGTIVSTRVVRNAQGKGRGVAFVNFESADSVELALKMHEEKFGDREIRVTRVKNRGQLEKMQKRKMVQATKEALSNKKRKPKKAEHSPNKSDKFQKKKTSSVDLKKKILAEKLTSKTKRKEKKSE